MEHHTNHTTFRRSILSIGRQGMLSLVLLFSACSGGDSGPEVNSPLSTPIALVVNQDDTTITTLRLDGKGAPVISTLSLGPAQADAIGGVTFSLGEWIFVTHTAGNRVAFIDPIGALTPILEDYLVTTTDPRIGLQPKRIYRDSVDKEVLWTMNEGDDPQCSSNFSTVSVLHNSHIAVGGDRPHVRKTPCLFGKGEQFAAFSGPTAANPGLLQRAFISSKTTGLVSVVRGDVSDGDDRWSALIPIDLCDAAKQTCDASPFTANTAAPAGMFWSQVTGKIYAFLSGYGSVAEIDPVTFGIPRRVDLSLVPFNLVTNLSVGITPNGRFLFLAGEDVVSDPAKVIGRFGVVDLTSPVLSVTAFSIPQLDNIRPARFQFAQDGKRLYLTQNNSFNGLQTAAQVQGYKKDKLLVFDPSALPAAPGFVAEIDLPSVGSDGLHGMDLWITGPQGAGSAKGVVVTNASHGINGSVSLIDAASDTITSTIPVGKNPKQVTVYYVGLAASDNQATPTW